MEKPSSSAPSSNTRFSYLKSVNAEYIDEVYARYLANPDSVEESWRCFFEGIEFGAENYGRTSGGTGATAGNASTGALAAQLTVEQLEGEGRVAKLIQAYRESGVNIANINPLEPPAASHAFLELGRFGLTANDLDKSFNAGKLLGLGTAKLRDIIAVLRETYCSSVGVEFIHIHNPEERDWVQSRMETSRNKTALDPETRKLIFKRLADAETFERFLHTRYVAQKRFSVEGGESVIPMLDCMIETSAEFGGQEVVIGMAHRGRLNVLTNIFGKKPEYIFTEFEGNYPADYSHGEGDVKYHKGYSTELTTRKGQSVHLSLANNPSHLEFVGVVVEGATRAKQQKRKDVERTQVMPIVIHGDAALAGQGVCYEALNLSELEGYATGGTLHIVINNQVGFTTSAKDARSTRFATDLAMMLETPIFHVNGDDPEAVWHVARLATEYRQKFHKDVFIDLICYRKHGHNEGDEPSFTQPVMYAKIKTHPSTREIYGRKLASAGVQTEADSQAVVDAIMAKLTEAQTKTRAEKPLPYVSVFGGDWQGFKVPTEEDLFAPVSTAVDAAKLKDIAKKLNTVPADFHLHPKLGRFLEARLKAVNENKGIDWGNAESLAYGSLVTEGHPVRLSGQDAERGTFTHRHAVFNDVENGNKLCLQNHLAADQAKFSVYNSHLSETGVLGFEHGYSLAAPNTLVLWEAQFGDFANGAQVIIDQFIATAESKWQRMSGLTLLLPHGYEGQGPEHSSARLERFLQLCGRNNIIVANLTTPAQIFHALRRQMKWSFRKPLVIMSPKSMLRNPMAVSTLDDLATGSFQEVIDDGSLPGGTTNQAVKRVLISTGKVHYDLVAKRNELAKHEEVALVRLEQCYPFPAWKLSQVLSRYPNAEFVWVQEEPRNMGAWGFIQAMWSGGLSDFANLVGGRPIRYVGRDIGASPAVGSMKLHEIELKAFLEKAFH
ncbi:MAG: 2-oxoglutarate dehydrogenase E1 component [Bdellovibrionales bacterium]|nr:2-oxoglutarate dehydrogenase E1 component [Bdellovibrionales bacterium]